MFRCDHQSGLSNFIAKIDVSALLNQIAGEFPIPTHDGEHERRKAVLFPAVDVRRLRRTALSSSLIRLDHLRQIRQCRFLVRSLLCWHDYKSSQSTRPRRAGWGQPSVDVLQLATFLVVLVIGIAWYLSYSAARSTGCTRRRREPCRPSTTPSSAGPRPPSSREQRGLDPASALLIADAGDRVDRAHHRAPGDR